MSSKSVQNKDEAYVANYKEMVKKLRELSKVAVREFLGTRPDGDPRVEYLANMDAFMNLANVHLEVLMELAIKKLGITREEYLKVQGDQLATQIQTIEKELCVTAWDGKGNPIFDLKAYADRTASWPK